MTNIQRQNWNDKVSSVNDYNKCDVRLFENVGYGGASTGFVNYGPNAARYLGAWNDRASSFVVS